MKKLHILLFVLISSYSIFPQSIGKFVPDPPSIVFPKNSLGLDIMFGEGGFGLGGFYRKEISHDLTFTTDISVSEAKDDSEVEYIDYFGRVIVLGKKNRIFLLPLNFGIQYRLFSNSVTDNLRPYVNAGVGPAIVMTTPFETEYFSAFGSGQARYTLGGYFGLGANFGINQSSLVGINLRYYVIHLFGEGVEGMKNKFQNNLGGFYLTINFGTMY